VTAPRPFIIAVTGMLAEARVAQRISGIKAIAGGGDSAYLVRELERAITAPGACGVLSFGIAGGLSPDAKPGDLIIATIVNAPDRTYATDAAWSLRLANAIPGARTTAIAGRDIAVPTPAAKSELFRQTGAAAVDMESHIAARVAAQHGLPFAVLRAVADHSDRELPRAALAGLGPGGAINFAGVLKSLARQPSQLPQLLRVSADTNSAMKALLGSLRAVRMSLPQGLGASIRSADLG
jgi:adenosylhomocysteine nucleosidase